MITLKGEEKLGPPLKVRIAIALLIVVGLIVPLLFFPSPRIGYSAAGRATNYFGFLAVGSAYTRKYGRSKNPHLFKYPEMLALGLMFIPHLWLLREGRISDMIHVHPWDSLILPVLILIAYYLAKKY